MTAPALEIGVRVPLSRAELPSAFLEEVARRTPGDPRLEMCIQCGTCGGSCPSAPDMDHTPREIFALIRAGEREKVLRSNTPWYCVSCYFCTVRCPQEVHVTDAMYTLKRMAIQEGFASRQDAPDFSQTFIGFVEMFGRSFELGLASRYHLTHSPLKKVGTISSLAMNMLSRDRLALIPKRIKDLGGLHAILAKAKSMTGNGKFGEA